MKHVELTISDSKLTFDTDENGWTHVKLITAESEIALGAEAWDKLKKNIYYTFPHACSTSEPEWLVSLAEKHCSLYRHNMSGDVEFFWQDANSKEIWRSVVPLPLKKNY